MGSEWGGFRDLVQNLLSLIDDIRRRLLSRVLVSIDFKKRVSLSKAAAAIRD